MRTVKDIYLLVITVTFFYGLLTLVSCGGSYSTEDDCYCADPKNTCISYNDEIICGELK